MLSSNHVSIPRFLILAGILSICVSVVQAAEDDEKGSPEQAEVTLVRLNITTETQGARESVEINGVRIPDYRPRIIQVFPATGIVLDEQGHILTFLGYRWVDIRSPNPRIDIFTGEGLKHKGKLIGIDQSLGAAVVLSLDGSLKRTPICRLCEIRDGSTVVSPVVQGGEFQDFRSAQIVSVGSLTHEAERGSLVLTFNQPLPGVGEPILNAEHQVLGFIASQQPSGDDPAGVRTIVYPMSQLLSSADRIIQAGRDVCTGWLGVYLDNFRLPSGKGILIKQIQADSPAQRAGLAPQDVLVRLNGREIQDAKQFIQLVQNSSVGSKVTLDVLRQGKPITLAALIGSRTQHELPGKFILNFPEMLSVGGQAEAPETAADVPLPKIGIETTPLTPELADALHMPGHEGLLVLKVSEGMAAGQAGVLVGDLIVSVDGDKIMDPQVLYSHIQSRGSGGRILLRLIRKGAEHTIPILLPKHPSRRP